MFSLCSGIQLQVCTGPCPNYNPTYQYTWAAFAPYIQSKHFNALTYMHSYHIMPTSSPCYLQIVRGTHTSIIARMCDVHNAILITHTSYSRTSFYSLTDRRIRQYTVNGRERGMV